MAPPPSSASACSSSPSSVTPPSPSAIARSHHPCEMLGNQQKEKNVEVNIEKRVLKYLGACEVCIRIAVAVGLLLIMTIGSSSVEQTYVVTKGDSGDWPECYILVNKQILDIGIDAALSDATLDLQIGGEVTSDVLCNQFKVAHLVRFMAFDEKMLRDSPNYDSNLWLCEFCESSITDDLYQDSELQVPDDTGPAGTMCQMAASHSTSSDTEPDYSGEWQSDSDFTWCNCVFLPGYTNEPDVWAVICLPEVHPHTHPWDSICTMGFRMYDELNHCDVAVNEFKRKPDSVQKCTKRRWASDPQTCGSWARDRVKHTWRFGFVPTAWSQLALRNVFRVPGFPEALKTYAFYMAVVYLLLVADSILTVWKDSSTKYLPHAADLCPYIPSRYKCCQRFHIVGQHVIFFVARLVAPYFTLQTLSAIKSFDAGSGIVFLAVSAEASPLSFAVYCSFPWLTLVVLELLAILPEGRYFVVLKAFAWNLMITLTFVFFLKFFYLQKRRGFPSIWDMIPIPACFTFNLTWHFALSTSMIQMLLVVNSSVSIVRTAYICTKMLQKAKAEGSSVKDDAIAKGGPPGPPGKDSARLPSGTALGKEGESMSAADLQAEKLQKVEGTR